MNILDIIKKKRDRQKLSQEEIEYTIKVYLEDTVTDYQMSSLLMAIYLNGLSTEERFHLTQTYINSGVSLDLSKLSKNTVDKHSTGGVGDKTSLILAPIVASYGVYVPMISGRSLGHTGGTLDKLESIPQYCVNWNKEEFYNILEKCHFVMAGQSADLVPADRRIYSLRDVTATVESPDLIVASIVSKKVAEGADNLVFDVKWGKGAFLKTYEQAEDLARLLLKTHRSFSKKSVAILSDMNEPLGRYVGNFLEIEEAIYLLDNGPNTPLLDLSLHLSAWMLFLAQRFSSFDEAYEAALAAVRNRQALDCFFNNMTVQGADVDLFKKQLGKRRAPYSSEFYAPHSGYISIIDAQVIGHLGMYLGISKLTQETSIIFDTGIEFYHKVGTWVKEGDSLGRIYAHDANNLSKVISKIPEAYQFSQEKIQPISLISRVLSHNDL